MLEEDVHLVEWGRGQIRATTLPLSEAEEARTLALAWRYKFHFRIRLASENRWILQGSRSRLARLLILSWRTTFPKTILCDSKHKPERKYEI